MTTASAPSLDKRAEFLRDYLRRLAKSAASLQARMSNVQAEIDAIEAEAKSLARRNGPPRAGTRRPKGENANAVKKVFDDSPGQGWTLQQLSEKTNLQPSSVQGVLRRGPYERGRDGIWTRKAEKPAE
jgi:hypothetical protein